MSTQPSWQPTASRENLVRRAQALAQVRQFFASRNVLEVGTPILINAPVTDVHIHSAEVHLQGANRPYFLHTSPEYAMKRLLAAGSGDVYQICPVVRGLERGKLHNAEFTLIEWYRLGFSLEQLMTEVAALACAVLGEREVEYLTYRDTFLHQLHIDPLSAKDDELRTAAERRGIDASALQGLDRDQLLDALMGLVIGPKLGLGKLTFIHRYPASQAALARLDPHDPRTALRFELYGEGIELANGFHELAAAEEQRARFESDRRLREQRGLPSFAIDENLLAALAQGLPDCSGVALGFDRLLMLATHAHHIDEVIAFPIENA
jgi:lysyl-tRNA synthetase class 2